ncbi:hypothetical protein JW960_06555 [candidate division KSB1 bacterium]|nr:hypothetical protein [candidate division KSB1 bacterium]
MSVLIFVTTPNRRKYSTATCTFTAANAFFIIHGWCGETFLFDCTNRANAKYWTWVVLRT